VSDGEDNTGRQRGEVVVSVALGFRLVTIYIIFL
jgi:hypothetical protein